MNSIVFILKNRCQNKLLRVNLRTLCSNKKEISKERSDDKKEVSSEYQWRASREREQEWYSKLKLFSSDSNNTDVIKFLQSDIDLRPSTIKNWYLRKQEDTERYLQSYIPERNQILGDNLAASHFIVYRGGKVKFHGKEKWIVHDENIDLNLPDRYVPTYIVQAIDCSGVNIFYEGLANFSGLHKLEWFSLNGCKQVDDWCLDRISNIFRDSIKYLDIRNCDKITYRGIGALHRCTKLEKLLLDSFTKTKELEMTCLMLQELSPKLDIRTQ